MGSLAHVPAIIFALSKSEVPGLMYEAALKDSSA